MLSVNNSVKYMYNRMLCEMLSKLNSLVGHDFNDFMLFQ